MTDEFERLLIQHTKLIDEFERLLHEYRMEYAEDISYEDIS